MSATLEALGNLSAAEEFFSYFALPFEPSVVHVNRLHILKRFNQYLRKADPAVDSLAEAAQFDACRALLQLAYNDFVRSTPAQEKVFKVFQEVDGQSHVSIDSLRSSLPPRSKAS
jgi:nitrogenase-stabilizing/protective protein